KPPDNVSHPNVEFSTTKPTQAKKTEAETFKWPFYGYTPARTRYLDSPIHPPFERLWSYKSGSLIEFQPVLADGVLYVVPNAGTRLWSAATAGRAFQQSGRFYSTPAVAYGRVFAGNTDGFVYSFAAHTGKLGWRYQTGNYVYSAPAVGPGPHGEPSVFIGSYD